MKVTRDSVSQSASDFSSLIAKIPNSTKVIYIPWQLSAKAQLFGQQLKAAGKNIPLFGSDGLFDPANFTIAGSYDSFFPVDVVLGHDQGLCGRARWQAATTSAFRRTSPRRSR